MIIARSVDGFRSASPRCGAATRPSRSSTSVVEAPRWEPLDPRRRGGSSPSFASRTTGKWTPNSSANQRRRRGPGRRCFDLRKLTPVGANCWAMTSRSAPQTRHGGQPRTRVHDQHLAPVVVARHCLASRPDPGKAMGCARSSRRFDRSSAVARDVNPWDPLPARNWSARESLAARQSVRASAAATAGHLAVLPGRSHTCPASHCSKSGGVQPAILAAGS